MNKIKFSHRYHKMPKDLSAPTMLMAVFNADTKEFGELFVKWDTLILENDKVSFYSLPKGKVLVLLLITQDYVWTTIRRWTPQKELYYRSLIGQDLQVEISP